MAGASSTSASLKEYLKRYENPQQVDNKKKKKKKKSSKPDSVGVIVVDQDPVWQKPLQIEEEIDDSEDEEKPQVDEDIEVKRMKRLELIKTRRPFGAISEDGSGWIPVSDSQNLNSAGNPNSDISPPRKRRTRNDSPSPEPELEPSSSKLVTDGDISPPRKGRARNDSPSPEVNDQDLSPPRKSKKESNSSRKRTARNDSPSPEPNPRNLGSGREVNDSSPPRRGRKHRYTPSPESEREPNPSDLVSDISPPRKVRKESTSLREGPKTGLVTGKDIKEEIAKKKKADWLRFKDMDPSISGRNAEPVYRDKKTGQRMSKDEILKSQKKEEKPKEIKLEWGKGLAQKREAEARLEELELEKDKPFARTRDDPELDRMMKDRVRWGDPMAHLVKKKQSEIFLADMGDDEKMKASGFIIPQDIPSHSWLKRGLEAALNRYSIKPGRHWDGVDRSTGFEKQMFKRTSEKQATEREAYLWSVSDM